MHLKCLHTRQPPQDLLGAKDALVFPVDQMWAREVAN